MPRCKKRKRKNSGRLSCANVSVLHRTQDLEVPKRFKTSHLTLPYAEVDACVTVGTRSKDDATCSTNQPFIFNNIANEYGENLSNPQMNTISQINNLTPLSNDSSSGMPNFQSPKNVRKRKRTWYRPWNKKAKNKQILNSKQLEDPPFTSSDNTYGRRPLNGVGFKLTPDVVVTISNYAQDLVSISEPITQINISHTLSPFERMESLCHCRACNGFRNFGPPMNTRSRTEMKNASLTVELCTMHNPTRKRGEQCCMFTHPAALNCTKTKFENDGISNYKFQNRDFSSCRSKDENSRLPSGFGHRIEMYNNYLQPQSTYRPKVDFELRHFGKNANGCFSRPSNLGHPQTPNFDKNGYPVVMPLRSSTFKNKGKYKGFRGKRNAKKNPPIAGPRFNSYDRTPTVKLEVPETSLVNQKGKTVVKKSPCSKNCTSTRFADCKPSVDCNVQKIGLKKEVEIPDTKTSETPPYAVNSRSMCRDDAGKETAIVPGNWAPCPEWDFSVLRKKDKMISVVQKCSACILKERDTMLKNVKIELGNTLSDKGEGPLGINTSSEKNIVETRQEDLKGDPNPSNSLEDLNLDSKSCTDLAKSCYEDRINFSEDQGGETPICDQSKTKGHVIEPIVQSVRSMDIRTSLNSTPESLMRIESSSEIPFEFQSSSSTVREFQEQVPGSVMFEQSGSERRHSDSGDLREDMRECDSRDFFHADSQCKLDTLPSTMQKRLGTSRNLRISEGFTLMECRSPIDIASSKLIKVRKTHQLVADLLKKGHTPISSLNLQTALPELYSKEPVVKIIEKPICAKEKLSPSGEHSGEASWTLSDDEVQPLISQDGECLDVSIANEQNNVLTSIDDQGRQPGCPAPDVSFIPEKIRQTLTDSEGHVEGVGGNFDRYGNWKEFHEICDKETSNGETLRILPWVNLD